MAIPPAVTTFGQLIDWLLRDRHDGRPYRMAKAMRISPGLPFAWRDGVVRAPSREKILGLCETYGLEYGDVLTLIYPPPTPLKRPPRSPTGGGAGQGRVAAKPRRKARGIMSSKGDPLWSAPRYESVHAAYSA